MSDEPFSFSTSAQALLALPVTEALRESDKQDCWDYGQVFFSRGKEAEANADSEAATAWRLLGQVVQISLQKSKPHEPFRPMFAGPNGRSLVPADLDETSAEAVHELAKATTDAELRARLFDVTWDRLRDPEAARQAVQSYVDSANHLFDPEHWTAYADRIERALRLARQLRDATLFDTVISEIDCRIVELDGSDPKYLTSRLMTLLDEFEKGDTEIMSGIATKAAKSAEETKDFERARSHFENLAQWRRRAKDQEGERDARIAIAASYVSQAELHSGPDGGLTAAHFLEKAHEAYRNIGGVPEKVEEVYGQLREAQRRARESLQEIRSERIDLSPRIKAARERVADKPFREALLALATVTQPTNFAEETKTARELMEKFPLQGILGGAMIEDDGRVVAHRTPAVTLDEEQAQQALWERAVEQVTMGYQISVQAEIAPAINQLNFEHSPALPDMKDLVINNPFVPPGHEELIAKGFLAGLRWDFPEALSILVPQLENSLRHLLSRTSAEVTRRDKLGLQTVIPLGTILSLAELEPILGDNLIKELKVLFTDQHGSYLRNRIAHGLMSHDEYFGHAAIYAWWFILFLSINPVRQRFISQTGRKEETAAPPESEEQDQGTE